MPFSGGGGPQFATQSLPAASLPRLGGHTCTHWEITHGRAAWGHASAPRQRPQPCAYVHKCKGSRVKTYGQSQHRRGRKYIGKKKKKQGRDALAGSGRYVVRVRWRSMWCFQKPPTPPIHEEAILHLRLSGSVTASR